MTTAGPAVFIENLTKYYRNKFLALKNVSFNVEQGDFFGFLGPNGAGKTTTINILTGLANFNEGKVKVFGSDVVSAYRETRRMIGLAPQEFNFDPYLSIQQILVYEGGYFGLSRRTCLERAKRLLHDFGLFTKRHEDYRKLSGGMKRRLLIARALIHDPQILILDEPTAGVDLELRYKLWQLFRQLNEQGKTIFLTTHYIEEAERLCNRIGVIHQGEIVALNEKDKLIQEISGHWVVIQLGERLPSLPPEIVSLGVSLEHDGHMLRFRENPEVLSKMMSFIYEGRNSIRHLEVKKATLEDTFIKLTGLSRTGEDN